MESLLNKVKNASKIGVATALGVLPLIGCGEGKEDCNRLVPVNNLKLDNYVRVVVDGTGLKYWCIDPKNHVEVCFVDEGLDGDLNYVVLNTSCRSDTIHSYVPIFRDFEQEFKEMRTRRFGRDDYYEPYRVK